MIKKLSFVLFLLFSLTACASLSNSHYPEHWWQYIPDNQRNGSWEILPHEAKKGEVILSKRNELGIFSNFGAAIFEYDGSRYGSIEGFWQMMKYPDPSDKYDPRNQYANEYPYTREEVKLLDGFISKKAGDDANKINKKYGFNKVSYKGKFFDYKDMKEGSRYHYKIIKEATREKVYQNKDIRELLLKTKGLKLMPDHTQGDNPPPSYKYFDILMDIRDSIKE